MRKTGTISFLLTISLSGITSADPVPGEFWNSKRDCSYQNPPKDRTAIVLSFDCETTTHNVRVIESGKDYYIPKSTANDQPPFCLVHGPAAASAIQVAKARQRTYCRK